MKKILIVEDEVVLAGVLAELLQSDGWSVEVCGNGIEALRKQPLFRPDVILSDIMMPKMDGLALLQEYYNRQVMTPVIFLTGHSDMSKMQNAWQNCAFDFLEKPFNAQKLLDTVQAAFEFGEDYVKIARKKSDRLKLRTG